MTGISLPPLIFLSTRVTDMRKSIDGLCGEAQDYVGHNPVDGSLFVFYNRRRDKLKMLWWDRDGYWVWYKRLEAGTFQMPLFDGSATSVALSGDDLHLILSGIDLASVKKRKRFRLCG
jgi:transposase